GHRYRSLTARRARVASPTTSLRRCSGDLLESQAHDARGLVYLLSRDDERRRDADDVAAHAALAQDEAVPPGRGHERAGARRIGAPVRSDELDRLHEPHAADLADAGVLRAE